jgi:L-amino acid N-acyltransferase YncA
MTTIQLRNALDGDLPTITALYAHHVLHGLASFEIDVPTEAEMRKRFASITAGGYPYLVAFDGDTVLGYSYANHYRTRPAYRYSVENSVYVADGATGRGIGKRLLTRLIAECESRGFRQMLAVIGDSANLASIELHRSCGFAQVGLLPAIGFKFGRWVDSVLMQRALGAGDATTPADQQEDLESSPPRSARS